MSRQDLTPDDKPANPLLAMDPDDLELVWASCTFGAKAALACTCRELQQKSQGWHWGRVPSQRWQQDGLRWWLSHRKLSSWNEYVVQTNGSMDRDGDYEAAEKVQAAWEPGHGKVMSGSLPDIGYDPVMCKAALLPDKDASLMLDHPTYLPLSRVISSSMLLYRLRCLFPSCEVEQSDGYEGVWRIHLRHKRTLCQAEFGDHKGAAILSGDASMKEDRRARQDLLDLVELLCSDCCPHTYDGTVAGCVA